MKTNQYQFQMYLRQGMTLAPADMDDLNEYFAALRSFYGIPANAPVFPSERKRIVTTRKQPRPQAFKATGRNRADHPWRNTL